VMVRRYGRWAGCGSPCAVSHVMYACQLDHVVMNIT